jgi:iron(III) transport system permease protein
MNQGPSVTVVKTLPFEDPAQPPPPRGLRWSSIPFIGRATPLHTLLAALLYVFFAVFLIWPIVQVVATGFLRKDGSFTLDYVRLIFADPVLVRGLVNATIVAVSVTLLSLLIAMPLAILSVRYDFPGRGILTGLLLVPLILPPFVGALGMRLVLGRFGPLTRLLGEGGPGELGVDWLGRFQLIGIITVEALHLYPIMLLNLQASLANLDPAMEQAAANLGASRWTIFHKVTLPLIRPGLFAGCTLVLIWSFTELGTPLIFDYYTITPVQVFKQIAEVAGNPLPYALVVVMLLASAALYIVGKVVLGRGFETATTKASVAGTARKLTGWKGVAAALPFFLVFALAVVPHLSVVLTSVSETGAWYKSILPQRLTTDHYVQALVDDLALPSVKNSLRYASFATVLAVVVGLAAAVVIVRSNVPGRGVIDSLAMLPLAVPGIVLAFGYLSLSMWLKQELPYHVGDPRGKLRFLDVQEYPVVLLVIAYAARRLPYVVRSAAAGLQQTPRDLELAASNLGASKATVLGRITVPLIFANLIAGALLAFAFAMLEVGDSIILAQRIDYYPITKAILDLAQRIGDGLYIASALGVWAMALLTLTILSANALLGKKMGAIFRV